MVGIDNDPFYGTSDISKFIAQVNQVRLSCDTLSNGELNVKNYNLGNTLVYSRWDSQTEMVVVINMNGSDINLSKIDLQAK